MPRVGKAIRTFPHSTEGCCNIRKTNANAWGAIGYEDVPYRLRTTLQPRTGPCRGPNAHNGKYGVVVSVPDIDKTVIITERAIAFPDGKGLCNGNDLLTHRNQWNDGVFCCPVLSL